MNLRRRILLLVLLLIAGTLCAGSVALWVGNLGRVYAVSYITATAFRQLTVMNGTLAYQWTQAPRTPKASGWSYTTFDRTNAPASWFSSPKWRPLWLDRPGNFVCFVPLWLIATPSLIASLLLGRALLRKRPPCPCGYDPTGLRPNAPCPECGRAGGRARR